MTDYAINKPGTGIIFTCKGKDSTVTPGVYRFDTRTITLDTLASGKGTYRAMVWDDAGGQAAFLEVEDMNGGVKAKLGGDRIETYAAILTSGEPVLVTGKVSFPMTDDSEEEKEPTLLVDSAGPLSERHADASRYSPAQPLQTQASPS